MDIKTPKVSEVKDVQGWQRVSTHSHVRGLGLDDTLDPRNVSQGLVGQVPLSPLF
jgi:RuvB-like protein 2